MIANLVARSRIFLQEDLWKVRIHTLPRKKAILYKQLRIWMIAISEFINDKCGEKASALTYFSLLSIVPVLAMAFGIAQMFGLKDYVQRELARYLEGQKDILDMVSGFANNMLSEAGGGVISGFSAVFLIYAVARLLNNIEISFNHIWDTPKGRSIKRMITDYMSIILLGPIILILSSSFTVFITTKLAEITGSIELLGYFRPVILFLIRLIPYSLIWFLLFLVYVIFPNTTVKIRPALIAGILAGTAYQLTQFGWIKGQVFLTKYSDIYGIFAALPLFMIWLQLSWMILLFGAEYAFAIQNVDSWAYDNEKLRLNAKSRRSLNLLILTRIVKKFEENDEHTTYQGIRQHLDMPSRLIRDALGELEAAGLISEIAGTEEKTYQPAVDIHKLDIHYVIEKSDKVGESNSFKLSSIDQFEQFDSLVDDILKEVKVSEKNKKILDLPTPLLK